MRHSADCDFYNEDNPNMMLHYSKKRDALIIRFYYKPKKTIKTVDNNFIIRRLKHSNRLYSIVVKNFSFKFNMPKLTRILRNNSIFDEESIQHFCLMITYEINPKKLTTFRLSDAVH